MPDSIVYNRDQVAQTQRMVRLSALRAREKLRKLSDNPMVAFHQLKFGQIGHNAVRKRPQSLIEQLYRTFKMMATLAAAERILKRFPNAGGLRLRLAQDFPTLDRFNFSPTKPGPEVESMEPDLLAAEVFAAVHSASNAALRKSCGRLISSRAEYRYVYFYSPRGRVGRRDDLEDRLDLRHLDRDSAHGIEIWALGRREIL